MEERKRRETGRGRWGGEVLEQATLSHTDKDKILIKTATAQCKRTIYISNL